MRAIDRVCQGKDGDNVIEPVALNKGTPGQPCPIEAALDVIGTKWTFLIIRDLLIEGTLRFSDLLKGMEGISPKTLSLRLKELEAKGIIGRKVYPEVPPRVEYTLTERGRQLEGIFIELKRFGLTLAEK
ncbi:winged helix-turn-helix transcriptional regulator [Paenibacillus glycanilyticus]|uniref:winged helix-turn-helix transcriptional regulator n=1 Tax=Paenibacillus glycanilyticus TaxID=126569 RepID=UPI003EBA1AAE